VHGVGKLAPKERLYVGFGTMVPIGYLESDADGGQSSRDRAERFLREEAWES
jgi:hypothetical protein